ncbi:MAG: hypothetical protein WC455_24915 [Dehalococcoidia bacterium]|jgi:hypothetical protein
MKTYFRLWYNNDGWAIQYKNGLSGDWKYTNHENMITSYQNREEARCVLDDFRNGKSDESWFDKEQPEEPVND